MDWVVADSDIFHTSRVLAAVQEDADYTVALAVGDGGRAMAAIETGAYQGVIVDLLLAEVEGLEVLRRAGQLGLASGVFTAYLNDSTARALEQLQPCFVGQKPIDGQGIRDMLEEGRERVLDVSARRVRDNCGLWLDAMGMSRRLLGHRMLRACVGFCVRHPALASAPHRSVYPTVAQQLDTTCLAVERNIRTAIESLWLSGSLEKLHAAFADEVSPERGKPTNRQMIAALCRLSQQRPGGETGRRG